MAWLMPSRLGTNSMAMGAMAAMAWASWPAPLGTRWDGNPARWAASAAHSCMAGVMGTGSVNRWRLMVMVTPSCRSVSWAMRVSSRSAASRADISRSRNSTPTLARPGMTLTALGRTSRAPAVATRQISSSAAIFCT